MRLERGGQGTWSGNYPEFNTDRLDSANNTCTYVVRLLSGWVGVAVGIKEQLHVTSAFALGFDLSFPVTETFKALFAAMPTQAMVHT